MVTFFRLLLAFPALIIVRGGSALLWTIGFLGWFVALFLRSFARRACASLGAYALRYGGPAERLSLPAHGPVSGLAARAPDPASP